MKKYIERLYDEWITHKKVIIAVDYDDTIKPWKFEKLNHLTELVNLLKRAKKVGCYIVVFSACDSSRYDEIRETFKELGIEIDSINTNPIDLPYGNSGSKIYFNILLDDRAGLYEAMFILTQAMYNVIGKQQSLIEDDGA